jgi:hypothetical protein
MQAILHVTKEPTVTPLIDIQHPAFADIYSKGLQRAMHGDYQGENPSPENGKEKGNGSTQEGS